MTGRKIVVASFIFCIGIVMLCLFPSISNAEATFTVQVGSPKISVSPKSVNFGSIGIGSTSDTKTTTITGKGYLTVNSITLTGANASEFNQTNDCSSIPPGGSCTIKATFSPKSSSGKKSATISISSNDPKKPTVNVKLSGQAAPKVSMEGTWDIQGKMTIKVNIKGYGSETQRTNFTDEFIFDGDGDFSMTDMDGTWSQNGSNFIVSLDPESVSDYFADNLSDEIGYDVSVEVTQMSFIGKKQKNGTIKGTIKLNLTFYIDDYDISGDVTVSTSYTGTQVSTQSISSMKENKASPMPGFILNVIQQELDNAVQPLDSMPLLK
jgi:hypothetical protein